MAFGGRGDVGVVECLLLLLFSFHLLCALALEGLAMMDGSLSELPGLPQSGRSKMEGREEGRFGGELGAWIGKSPKG